MSQPVSVCETTSDQYWQAYIHTQYKYPNHPPSLLSSYQIRQRGAKQPSAYNLFLGGGGMMGSPTDISFFQHNALIAP